MLMEASGDIVAKVGDTVVAYMDREAVNDYPLGLCHVTVEIVTFESDQEIAWIVHGQIDLVHLYGYGWIPSRRPNGGFAGGFYLTLGCPE